MSALNQLLHQLDSLKNPAKAKDFSWFFKTGPGQYGEGDQFLGIMTNPLREVISQFWSELTLADIETLLNNPYHECRSIAVSVLCRQFAKADLPQQQKIYDFYLTHTNRINNWDLVDISAPNIVGQYLLDKDRKILYQLAKSDLLWDRRISIISTLTFIRNNQFTDTLEISKLLFNDQQDLMHKAVGWMLREVGKRDQKVLTDFLDKYCLKMPRTALRYSIERFSSDLRQYYLKLK